MSSHSIMTSEKQAYQHMIYFGLTYLLKPESRNDSNFQKLDETWKRLGYSSFIEHVAIDSLGFPNVKEALEFGDFIRWYWKDKNRLPKQLPNAKMIREILTETN